MNWSGGQSNCEGAPQAIGLPAGLPNGPGSGWRKRLRHWLDQAPRLCPVCQMWCQSSVCAACQERFFSPRVRCMLCARPQAQAGVCGDCLLEPPPWKRVVTLGDYRFPLDRLIPRMKYGRQPDLALTLGTLFAQALPATKVEGLCFVPSHPARLAERGYNQAALLASEIAGRLRLPLHASLIERWQAGEAQAGLGRQQRLRGLAQAGFMPAPGLKSAKHPGSGRRLALVDDVLTTGATARAATKALLEAGVAEVELWVLARTPAPGEFIA